MSYEMKRGGGDDRTFSVQQSWIDLALFRVDKAHTEVTSDSPNRWSDPSLESYVFRAKSKLTVGDVFGQSISELRGRTDPVAVSTATFKLCWWPHYAVYITSEQALWLTQPVKIHYAALQGIRPPTLGLFLPTAVPRRFSYDTDATLKVSIWCIAILRSSCKQSGPTNHEYVDLGTDTGQVKVSHGDACLWSKTQQHSPYIGECTILSIDSK